MKSNPFNPYDYGNESDDNVSPRDLRHFADQYQEKYLNEEKLETLLSYIRTKKGRGPTNGKTLDLRGGGPRKIITEGAPRLGRHEIDNLESFLSWGINLRGFLGPLGRMEFVIGPRPDEPDDATELKEHMESLAEGLRYLCYCVGDNDMRTAIQLEGGNDGTLGWNYLINEVLQGQSEQAAYMTIIDGMTIVPEDSPVIFRNHWAKFVAQLDPLPHSIILCEKFNRAIIANTDGYYEDCLTCMGVHGMNDHNDYTRQLVRLCQRKKVRGNNKPINEDVRALSAQIDALSTAIQKNSVKSTRGLGTKDAHTNYVKGATTPYIVLCWRCNKKHQGGIRMCKEEKKVCTFKFPDGTVCSRDHHIDHCFGKHPELIKDAKLKGIIMAKLNKNEVSANHGQAGRETLDTQWAEDSGSDSEIDINYTSLVPKTKTASGTQITQTGTSACTSNQLAKRRINKQHGIIHVDTGASHWIINDPRCITEPEKHIRTKMKVKTGNQVSETFSKGPATFIMKGKRNEDITITREVYYAPDFGVNLLSYSQDSREYGTKIEFNGSNKLILQKGEEISFEERGGQYLLSYRAPFKFTQYRARSLSARAFILESGIPKCRWPKTSFYVYDHEPTLRNTATAKKSKTGSLSSNLRALQAQQVEGVDIHRFCKHRFYKQEKGEKEPFTKLEVTTFCTSILKEECTTLRPHDLPHNVSQTMSTILDKANEEDKTLHTHDPPHDLSNAIKSKDNNKWYESMGEELETHRIFGTWEVVPTNTISAEQKRIKTKWVYDSKKDQEGGITKFKSRLCAQVSSEEEEEEYLSIFPSTEQYQTLRTLLSATNKKLKLSSVDIKLHSSI